MNYKELQQHNKQLKRALDRSLDATIVIIQKRCHLAEECLIRLGDTKPERQAYLRGVVDTCVGLLESIIRQRNAMKRRSK